MCRAELPRAGRAVGPGDSDVEADRGHGEAGEASWAALAAAEREEMEEAAAQGHVKAQACLGYIYSFGDGVTQDDGRAFEAYRQAAQQGHTSSQSNLGVMYRRGEGCEQSHERAAEWWARAGSANSA